MLLLIKQKFNYLNQSMTMKSKNNKKPEPLTMYKNNSRNCSDFKGFSLLQLSCNLTGMKPAIGYYSYTKRWV